MACEPETDLENAGQFSSIIPPGMHAAVQSYLLAKIRGGSMDVNEILQDATCHSSCIPPGLLPRIKTYLLCQLSNTGGGEITPEPPDCDDEDALAFFDAAAITDATQRAAICQLVSDLKTYPAVGTKYWDRQMIIYPFVGGNATSHSVNLKNPGTNDLVFFGTGFTHSALGVKSSGVAATYATTNFLIPSQNTFRVDWYLDLDSTISNSSYFGASGPSSILYAFFVLATLKYAYRVNDGTNTTTTAVPPINGLRIINREIAATRKTAFGISNWESTNVVSAAPSARYIMLFAVNNLGVAPVGAPSGNSNSRISSWSCGDPLATADNAEHLEYKGIWDTFHTTLGRGHP